MKLSKKETNGKINSSASKKSKRIKIKKRIRGDFGIKQRADNKKVSKF